MPGAGTNDCESPGWMQWPYELSLEASREPLMGTGSNKDNWRIRGRILSLGHFEESHVEAS